MSLTKEQIQMLLTVVSSTSEDDMDCDDCLDHVAEYAETRLADKKLSDIEQAVQTHLANCPCCKHEFELFLEALRGMNSPV